MMCIIHANKLIKTPFYKEIVNKRSSHNSKELTKQINIKSLPNVSALICGPLV